MSSLTHHPGDHDRLRSDAEERLREGTAPPSRGWTISPDALALLYRLASNPTEAGEALKLLHELQTHQVELDLQHEQLVANEQELAQERDRYKALFDFAPVGYFAMTPEGQVIEANLAGAQLLGAASTSLVGESLAGFLAHGSQPALTGLLGRLRDGHAQACCEVQRTGEEGVVHELHVVANTSASGDSVLLIVSPSGQSPEA
ncbi:hypothetical protein D893_02611 [Thioalkalivibrio sp. ALE21]|uniref:PAS domain-containing protein n=1 Tax=Thioalkalivibrio sp. ALE21 TaxID=1158175 RepID=UPI000D8AA5EA|nr:PAS domain-containing protein [Thioalkalivibrio sp. ALE21]PYF99706.1 hypothetical protein D893_02611 [Thioalkalivibrio sp. ALE21]